MHVKYSPQTFWNFGVGMMGLSEWMTAVSDTGRVQDGWVQIRVPVSGAAPDQMTDGAQMHYLKVGHGAPLILVHGLLGSSHNWRYNMHELAQNSTVYAIDMLGAGLSERVPGLDGGMRAMAARIIAFMNALRIPAADFVATSHGGAVTMLLAAHYPDRVKKLVLAAPVNPWSTESDSLVHFYRNSIGKWLAPQMLSTSKSKMSGSFTVLPHVLQELAVGWMYGSPTAVCTATLENYMTALRVPYTSSHVLNVLDRWSDDVHDLAEAIVKLRKKPVQLLWGDHDRSVELSSAYAMLQHLPLAELTVLRGAGHMLFEEFPVDFDHAVRSWLENDPENDLVETAAANASANNGFAGTSLPGEAAKKRTPQNPNGLHAVNGGKHRNGGGNTSNFTH
jgi:pimeloyl-ACP methyl ester carboxylesterase